MEYNNNFTVIRYGIPNNIGESFQMCRGCTLASGLVMKYVFIIINFMKMINDIFYNNTVCQFHYSLFIKRGLC